MENNEETRHECCRCGHFTAYYTKGYSQFCREKCGYCSKYERLTDKHYGCEFWKSKYYRPRNGEKIALETLRDVGVKLSAIELILEEDRLERRRRG